MGWGRGVQRKFQISPSPVGPPELVPSASLRAPRSMVAVFDYNPRESSPNVDVEVRTFGESPANGGGGRASPGLTAASWFLHRQSCPSEQGMSSLFLGAWTMMASTM